MVNRKPKHQLVDLLIRTRQLPSTRYIVTICYQDKFCQTLQLMLRTDKISNAYCRLSHKLFLVVHYCSHKYHVTIIQIVVVYRVLFSWVPIFIISIWSSHKSKFCTHKIFNSSASKFWSPAFCCQCHQSIGTCMTEESLMLDQRSSNK